MHHRVTNKRPLRHALPSRNPLRHRLRFGRPLRCRRTLCRPQRCRRTFSRPLPYRPAFRHLPRYRAAYYRPRYSCRVDCPLHDRHTRWARLPIDHPLQVCCAFTRPLHHTQPVHSSLHHAQPIHGPLPHRRTNCCSRRRRLQAHGPLRN
ncbi:hypothetical protein [Kribbella qitaiheensis]|uniref:hypothetical protein n=1 Tax=Kribbella qitaiheensis TaxID=1544730 RepID=UPI00162AAB3E|nr:hypothetical protein [Kribbella qitaiheensis]